ncbi:MAG: PIN domain-containing protein [Bifidobacterium longum]
MTDVSMQRILLDTNVLLDYLLHRDDHAKMAEAVMELGAKNNITLLCASLSLKDIAYLSSSAIRREFKPNESEVENFTRGFLSSRVPWRCIEQVKEMCDIVAVDESTCDKAFSLQKRHRDFEDDPYYRCRATIRCQLCGHIGCRTNQSFSRILQNTG